MHKTHTLASHSSTGLGIVLLTGGLLTWLAAIALEASTPRASTWSAPWIGAYALAIASGLVMGRTRPGGTLRWLAHAGAVLTVTGAMIRTIIPSPVPPAAGALTAVDIPLLLALGLMCLTVVLGNRPSPENREGGSDTGVAVGVGLMLVWGVTLLTEYVARPNLWHGPQFYVITGAALPWALAFAATASPGKWTATKAAAIYMVLVLVAMWGFQAVPVPNGGPDADQLGHLLPPPFPLVLVLPAVVMDGILTRLPTGLRWWWRAAAVGLAGMAFVVVMGAVHWPLSDFLLSPSARTALFGANRWPFYADLGDWRYQYWTLASGTRGLAAGLIVALALSTFSGGIGHWLGRLAASAR
jgi:hypothetical protein